MNKGYYATVTNHCWFEIIAISKVYRHMLW